MSDNQSDALVAGQHATQLLQAAESIRMTSEKDIDVTFQSNIEVIHNVQSLLQETKSYMTTWMTALERDIQHIQSVADEFQRIDDNAKKAFK